MLTEACKGLQGKWHWDGFKMHPDENFEDKVTDILHAFLAGKVDSPSAETV
jgi:hypothetical protein